MRLSRLQIAFDPRNRKMIASCSATVSCHRGSDPATPNDSPYDHLNLNDKEIRLCTIIAPPEGSNALWQVATQKGSLRDRAGRYRSLSHIWGDKSRMVPIIVNGCLTSVRANLHKHLRRLHELGLGEHVWIDALCINQTDVSERAHQVELMGDIYAGAKEVLVGIDDGKAFRSDDCASAGPILAGLTKSSHFRDLPSLCGLAAHEFQASCKALCQLLDSAWFRRAWTVQEICRAKQARILCPYGLVTWDDFARALFNWDAHRRKECCSSHVGLFGGDLEGAFYRTYCHVENIQETREALLCRRQHIREALLRYQDTIATEPVDKIFALYSLHTVASKVPLPPPDYGKTAVDVFTDFTLWLLNDMRSLLVLALENRRGCDPLPSWVPNFAEQPVVESNYGRLRHKFLSNYDAGKGQQAVFQYLGAGRLLLNGVRIGRVEAVTRDHLVLHSAATHNQQHAELLRKWRRFTCWNDSGTSQMMDPCLYDAFAVLMMGSHMRDIDGAIRQLTPLEVTRWQEYVCELSDTGPGASSNLFHSEEMLAHLATALERRLFRTSCGRFGVGHKDLEVGDLIWVFGGGRAPFILRSARPAIDSSVQYKLVGHCYLEGVMHGESIMAESTIESCVLI